MGVLISAEQFKNKATRVIQIPGFEPGEQIEVRIKPVSMMAMMTNGRLPNELKVVASELFKSGMNGKEADEDYSMEQIQLMTQLIDKLCEDCLVEPVFNDIKDAIVYWYNTGNGLRTIIFDLWLGNKSTLIIFGKDDMYRVIDDLNSFNPKEGKQYLYI